MKKKAILFILIFSLVLSLITILLIPKTKFNEYIIEMVHKGGRASYKKVYFYDLDNDGVLETIDFIFCKIPGNSINIKQGNKTIDLYNLRKNEEYVSLNLKIADADKNNKSEIYFISALDSVLYLNILKFDDRSSHRIINTKIKVDSFSYYNGTPDAVNRNIKVFDNNIAFEIQAGFNIYPRNIYIYNTQNGSIKKTDTTSIVCSYIDVFSHLSKNYILSTNTSASGNTISPQQYEEYKKTTNKDSIEILKIKKNKVYKYGDFSSYILLYNDNLKFEFEPIEYTGWTNYTSSNYFYKDDKPYILSVSNNVSDTINNTYITVCNLDGQIIKQIKLKPYYYLYSNPQSNYFIISNPHKKDFQVYSNELVFKYKLENITNIIGFKDINNDGKKEFITRDNDRLVIFNHNLKKRTEFNLKNNDYSNLSSLNIYTHLGKTYFYFYTKHNFYTFEYTKNKYSILKYPLFAIIWAFWFVVLYLFLKLNTKRLKADNLRLEKIVTQRTTELKDKNEILHSQKEEIIVQADELLMKNEYLQELGNFKKTMTDTIIHDLKNPLNIILNKTSDKQVENSAKKMLNLVLNILDVEKYDKTEFVIKKEIFLLNSILEDIVSDFKIICQQKNISIKTPVENYEILADKNVIIRVFENLLSNAFRFANTNSEIEITANKTSGEEIKIQVKNYGQTIKLKNINSIFDKYMQDSVSETRNYKSTGLGLTYCKMAIEAHKHTITVKNIKNKGVVFKFTLTAKLIKSNNEQIATNSKTVVADNDLLILQNIIPVLESIEFYKISEIMNVINQIPENNQTIIDWKNEIKSSVFSGNKQLFSKLLDIKELQ